MMYLIHMQERAEKFTSMVLCGLVGLCVGGIVFGLKYEASAFILLGNVVGMFVPSSLFARYKG